MTRDDLVERLLRAGYHEGVEANEFAAGSYLIRGDTVELTTNDPHQNPYLPAQLRIQFKNNVIAGIEDVTHHQAIKETRLPAELLTADLNTKKQTHSATNFNELPKVLIDALCAIEDRNFFSHDGVDSRAIARAFFKNLFHSGIREGGSTITQQLIKNQFLTPERTYQRKVAEAMMATALEHRLSKEQILALYCDRVYLGQSGVTAIYGFKQAARDFLGKELKDLSVTEAALLAGLVKAPNRYSPQAHFADAIARRDLVLDAMVETGAITEDGAATAKREKLAILPPQDLDKTAAPHFVDYVKRELDKRRFDEDTAAHLRVETTLDLDLQEAANAVVASHLDKLDKVFKKRATKPEAGLIAIDPHTGEILAMVGGRDYAISQLNRVTDAMRQPGSVFKPVVYAAAMAQGISPMTMFMNAPHEIHYGYREVYNPQNFGHSYSNTQVTLREAIVRSLNVVAVDAAMQVGLGNVAEMAESLGLEQSHLYPSMALGTSEATPLQIAGAYTTFANDGMRIEPQAIRSIGLSGEAPVPITTTKTHVMSPQTAYVITETLADVMNRGTAARVRALGYRGPGAGKTGTSRDAWFAGYTPNLLVVVWVGFDDNSNLNMTGGDTAVPIWTDFINRALELRSDLAATQFDNPGGLAIVEIDPETGMIANQFCPHRQKMTLPSYLLPGVCYSHQETVAALEPPTIDSDPFQTTEQMVEEDLDKDVTNAPPLPVRLEIPKSGEPLRPPPPPPPPARRNW
jgi:penicillin-binding protein 1B